MNVLSIFKKKRIFQYDLLRAIAIIAVVANHTLTKFYNTESDFIIKEYFNTFLRFAVPVFLFLSGALYKKNKKIKYLIHKLKRVLVPYLVYFIPSTLYLFWTYKWPFNDYKLIFSGLILGRDFGYYFIFVIVLIFLLAHFILQFGQSSKYFRVLFILSLIANNIWMSIDEPISQVLNLRSYNFFNFQLNDTLFYRNPLTWFTFFAFGLLYQEIAHKKFTASAKKIIIFFAASAFLTYNLMYYFNIGDYAPYGSIIWAVYSFSTIPLLLSIRVKNSKIKKIIKYISSISYPIFFLHYFILYAFMEIEKISQSTFSYWMAPVCFVCSLGGSILIITIWKNCISSLRQNKLLIARAE